MIAPGTKNKQAFMKDCGNDERAGTPSRDTILSTAVNNARFMGTSPITIKQQVSSHHQIGVTLSTHRNTT
jgi:hypothetical protein